MELVRRAGRPKPGKTHIYHNPGQGRSLPQNGHINRHIWCPSGVPFGRFQAEGAGDFANLKEEGTEEDISRVSFSRSDLRRVGPKDEIINCHIHAHTHAHIQTHTHVHSQTHT